VVSHPIGPARWYGAAVDGFLHSIEHGMFVRTRGTTAGRALVYLHGLGESGLSFERFAHHPALARFRHVIPDLRGYGRSPWPAHAASLDDVAGHVAGWLAARGEQHPIVIGHSMGGVLGVLLAESYPHALGGLVDIEGNASLGDCVFSGRAASCSLPEFIGGGFDELRERVYLDGRDDPALRGYYASMRFADPRVFHRHAQDLVDASRDESMATRLAALQVPRVVIAGVPGGLAARSLALLDAAAVPTVRIEPAGHWPFIDQPDPVAAAIVELVARCAA
jgi:pimeloyl-ACP methyl ester carboxylesterase